AEEPPPPPPTVVETPREEPDVLRVEAPELEGPKVINKIDLSAIDSSTRPKKGQKKEEPATESIQRAESAGEQAAQGGAAGERSPVKEETPKKEEAAAPIEGA